MELKPYYRMNDNGEHEVIGFSIEYRDNEKHKLSEIIRDLSYELQIEYNIDPESNKYFENFTSLVYKIGNKNNKLQIVARGPYRKWDSTLYERYLKNVEEKINKKYFK